MGGGGGVDVSGVVARASRSRFVSFRESCCGEMKRLSVRGGDSDCLSSPPAVMLG